MDIYISCIKSALKSLACACIDTHWLNQRIVLLFLLGTTALPLAACKGGGGGSSDDGLNASGNSASAEANNPPVEEANDPPVEEANDPPVEEANDPPAEEANDPPVEEANNPPGGEAYFDDTHKILQSGIDIEVVSGPFGYDTYQFSEQANGEQLALDARNASFIVANSVHTNPVESNRCYEVGSLPVNEYPVKVYDDDETWFVGGIIKGEVPQDSDWRYTYCNSAGILFKDNDGGFVDGMRITDSWDSLRAGNGTSGLWTFKNNWFTNSRDDIIENDYFHNMVFEDNLADGAFQGISINSGSNNLPASSNVVELYGNVIRIKEYLYKGDMKSGALFKNQDESPTSIIENTVVAVSYNGGITFGGYWERTWSKIDSCDNNLFLWLSTDPIPSGFDIGNMPACFTLKTGAEAQTLWDDAKQNWIDCHPKVSRMPSDPASNPAQCVANTFGGYSR